VDLERFEQHLRAPVGRGHDVPGAHSSAAGGAACGDLVRISLAVEGECVSDAGFQAEGCGAIIAAGSAAVDLLRESHVLDAARIGAREIAAELGGLSPGKFHAADLAADALHRALGAAARADAGLPTQAGRVLVAMSGGVDSAAAALLCGREDGAEVAGVTLELWSDAENDPEGSCCSASAVRGARALAHRLGMPHFTLDLRDEFRAGVVEPFLASHGAGETPNPCVRCNGHVRLDAMLDFAASLGAEHLATGHYARIERHEGNGALLRAPADANKDQTYMLAALEPGSLRRLRFPLGDLTKPEVRELVRSADLPVADKPDSQDLCFLAGTDRASFLRRHGGTAEREGDLVDSNGKVLGRHSGHQRFTVGQRRGIGVGATEPLFVLSTDAESNRVVVGPRAELRAEKVAVRGARLFRDGARVDRVKLRYRSRPLPARVAGDPGAGAHRRLALELSEPAEGAAPGQLACLMEGDLVVGWGTITRG
jgi:tRNA-specific 2-thiouridylase